MKALTGLSGLGGLIGGGAGDTTAPTLTGASIDSDGTTWTLEFSETVLGFLGFTADASGGAVSLSYLSGEGTNVVVFESDRAISFDEVVTLDYTPGDVEDVAGNAMEAFTDYEVVNGSLVGAATVKTQMRYGLSGRRYGSFSGR